jgi:phosphoglycolate phosphatase
VNQNDAALALFWRCDAVVFDLDGTLVQTLDGLHQALNEALCAHGFAPVSANLVRGSMHGGFLGSVRAALEGRTVVQRHQVLVLETYRARYRELMLSRSLVYAQVRDVLQAQQARGCRLAVCSNRDESLAIELLQGVGLRGAFDAIVGLRAGSEPKPKPDLLLRSLRELGVVASRALMVGDSAADVGCAAAVGVPCLVFEGGYGADNLGPSVTSTRFSSYQELLLALPQSA